MYTVYYESTSTGYSAWVEGTPAYTTAETLEELPLNILEAINLHRECSGKTIPVDLDSIQLIDASVESEQD